MAGRWREQALIGAPNLDALKDSQSVGVLVGWKRVSALPRCEGIADFEAQRNEICCKSRRAAAELVLITQTCVCVCALVCVGVCVCVCPSLHPCQGPEGRLGGAM